MELDKLTGDNPAKGNTSLHKKKIALPAIAVAVGVSVVALFLVMKFRSAGSNSAAQAGNPYPVQSPASPFQDSTGWATANGIQEQIGNLAQATSEGFQSLTPPPNPTGIVQSDVAGSIAGTDAGWFFGARPTSDIPSGDELQWRYTSNFLNNNPQFSSSPAVGAGPPPGEPAPQYSWEWRVVPKGTK